MTDETTDLPDRAGAVCVAHVHADDVSYSWHHSMIELIGWDLANHGRVLAGGQISMRCGTDGLVEARNMAVRQFLDEAKADWLFWTDTDMGFPGDTVDALMAAADPAERPIVGALCFSQRETDPDGVGGWRTAATPTIFDWATLGEQSGFAVRWDYPRDTVVKCAGTGSACVLIHRGVFERIEKEIGACWYTRLPNPSTGQLISEDLSLCVRAGALGIPVYVHTGVRTTHAKRVWLTEADYWQQRAVNPPPEPVSRADLPVHVDVPASLVSLARNEHVQPDGMLKLPADLDRYRAIIEVTRPEVLVETGTRTGASARWFAEQGLAVITVDIDPGLNETLAEVLEPYDSIDVFFGDAADPAVAGPVRDLVNGRRCMVVLDSDHSGPHVAKEIDLYGPLVTPGCYLVVEDGIFGYAPPVLSAQHGLGDMVGSPLDAIAEKLVDNPAWSRDVAVERLSPTTHHPAGWWVRNG